MEKLTRYLNEIKKVNNIMDYKIFFRTDASLKIGTGHVMRCLTLAKELKKTNRNIEFITKLQEYNMIEKIMEEGFKVHLIIAENKDEDAIETLEIIDENSIVIVDSYELDSIWEIKINKKAKNIIVIDDLANRKHICDFLIDPTFGDIQSKYNNLVPEYCKVLVGEKYIFLRDEFIVIKNSFIRDVKNITIHIFFGGNDIWDYSYKYSKWIMEELNSIQVKLVIGKSYNNLIGLEKLKEKYLERFEVYQDVNNMAVLMSECDIAIGAPGNATWERMVLGLPTIYLANNKNQIGILEKLQNQNLCLFLGMAEKIDKKDFIESLKSFINKVEIRLEMSKKGMTSIDGLGKNRVAQIIKKLTEEV